MPISDKTQLLASRIPAPKAESKVYVGRIPAEKYNEAIVKKQQRRLRSDIPGIKILGSGSSPGSKLVRNEDLAELGYDPDWIVQRTGIKARHHVAPGEATSDMAIRAAEQCLERAGVDASEVDLIIVATISPDHITPSTACIVQAHLGSPAAALDINAACSGFIYGLVMASQSVRSGCTRHALIIGAETLTMYMNPADKKTYPLFGDGAGAVLISADAEPDEQKASGILAYRLASEGKLGDALKTPAGGSRKPFSQSVLDNNEHYLAMDGRAVFKWAVRLIPEIVDEMLTKANMSLDDIDLFIPHQANIRIIDAAVEGLGIDRDKVFVNLDRYGNTSAASIPISISEAVAQGKIQPGSNVLMVGFGAGLTWGSCLFRW
ncbi:MAG: 3-oxoacyl-[acyl-carrier-protein] synthase-3 [Mariniblastus sp.]|jgi:3-oxoacyl-[acyl-carrier-protein] synthase-3